jgi:hypothetical protein
VVINTEEENIAYVLIQLDFTATFCNLFCCPW